MSDNQPVTVGGRPTYHGNELSDSVELATEFLAGIKTGGAMAGEPGRTHGTEPRRSSHQEGS